MKKLLSITALGLFFVAGNTYANFSQCPKGSKHMVSCKSTPKAGDSEVASKLMDEVHFCSDSKSNELYLIMEVYKPESEQDRFSPAVPCEMVRTAGGSICNISELNFSFVFGRLPNLNTGKLNVELGDQTLSSTFTCK